MKIMNVLDNNNVELFTGTKQDCMQFVKKNQLQRGTYKIQEFEIYEPTVDLPPPTVTTSPQKPKGIFKRIFSK